MNRRNFLKRIAAVAAVAAGAIAAPAVAKNLLFKQPSQRNHWSTRDLVFYWEFRHIGYPYDSSPPSKPSKYPDYELGTYYYAANGTVYKYAKLRK